MLLVLEQRKATTGDFLDTPGDFEKKKKLQQYYFYFTMSSRGKKRREAARKKKAEEGWNLRVSPFTTEDKLPKYQGLYDPNLRHHFESRAVQSNLFRLGMIDREGRVLDIEKQKSKLFIIEQEFKAAEKSEIMRLREEADMRQRVQSKRHETLERGRRAEKLMKIKDDRRIRSEILRAAKGEVSAPPVKTRGRRGKRGGSHKKK